MASNWESQRKNVENQIEFHSTIQYGFYVHVSCRLQWTCFGYCFSLFSFSPYILFSEEGGCTILMAMGEHYLWICTWIVYSTHVCHCFVKRWIPQNLWGLRRHWCHDLFKNSIFVTHSIAIVCIAIDMILSVPTVAVNWKCFQAFVDKLHSIWLWKSLQLWKFHE